MAQQPSKLPSDQAELDKNHLRVFANKLPWWFRPTLRESKFTVTDFISNVRGRLERNINTEDPAMKRIFSDRWKLAQHIAFRSVRDSASVAKVPGLGGKDAYTEWMQRSVEQMHKAKRFGIPQGDPLFGKYGTATREKTTGDTLYLVDLTALEKKLVQWLQNPDIAQKVFGGGEMWRYAEAASSVGTVTYASEFRTKIWDIVAGQTDESLDAPWREECVGLCIDQLDSFGGDRMMAKTDILDKVGIAGDLLSADPQEVLTKVIDTQIHNPASVEACFALMEQMVAMAAEAKNDTLIQEIAKRWGRGFSSHDLACCDYPAAGVAGLTAKCAVENIGMLKQWMAVRPDVK